MRLPPEQTLVAVVAPEKERSKRPVPGRRRRQRRLRRRARLRLRRAAPAAGGGRGGRREEAAPAKEGREEEVAVAVLLVVGLGNPGASTRGAGTTSASSWPTRSARRAGLARLQGRSSRGVWTRGELAGGAPVALLKPQTYMNLSGDSVQPAAAFLKVRPGATLVVHDELDLPWSDVRLKVGGGHAGHNGLRSIIQRLGTPDFVRVRVGIGKPPAGLPRGRRRLGAVAASTRSSAPSCPTSSAGRSTPSAASLKDGLAAAMNWPSTHGGAASEPRERACAGPRLC